MTIPEDDAGARRLLEAGSQMAGAASGAAAGALLGGPAGAVEGATAGAAISSILVEIGSRLLGRREMMRVGGAAIYAGIAYEARIAEGSQLRDDFWFADRPGGRSVAAEICEGTLLTAQREHEERKIEFYGYLLANLGFTADVDEYLANWLIRLADELTWMQLVLLAMVGRKAEFELPDIALNDRGSDWVQWGLHEQLADLGFARRELVLPESKGGSAERTLTVGDRVPNLELRGAGQLIFELMWLARVPSYDIEQAIALLQPTD